MLKSNRKLQGHRDSLRLSAPFQLAKRTMSREFLLATVDPDIKFIVEGSYIFAHSLILARTSEVFHAMFFGAFKREKVIEVPDVDAKGFELVLQAIYEDCSIFTNVPATLCIKSFLIADKYNLKAIGRDLSERIHKKVDPSNVFEILTLAKHVSMPHVLGKCWSVIERETLKAIKTPGFLMVDWYTICDMLDNNHLTVREYELASAIWAWCKEKKQTTKRWTNESLIAILGVAVYKIRFPLMTKGEFARICKSGILRVGEMESLRQNYRKNPLFPTVQRRNICMCQRDKASSCPLCKTKVLPYPRSHLYPIELNNNTSTSSKINAAASQTGPICQCRKYLSCPAFPNGASARILFYKGLIHLP